MNKIAFANQTFKPLPESVWFNRCENYAGTLTPSGFFVFWIADDKGILQRAKLSAQDPRIDIV